MGTNLESLESKVDEVKAESPAGTHHFGRVELMLILTSTIWGVNYSVVKAALADFHPMVFNGFRFVLASTILGSIVGKRLRWSLVAPEDRWPIVRLGLLGCGLYQIAFIEGIHLTLAGNAALIQATSPILTTVLSASMGHDLLNKRARLGVSICFVGMVTVIWNGPHQIGLHGTTLGNLLILLATIIWSLYSVGVRDFTRRYGSLETSTMVMAVGTAPLLLTAIPGLLAQNWTSIRAISWAGLGFSGLFAIALSYLLWNHGIKHIGGTRTSSFSNLTPVVALLIAWLTLGERPNPYQLVGAATILLGLYLTRSGTRTIAEAAPEPSAVSICSD